MKCSCETVMQSEIVSMVPGAYPLLGAGLAKRACYGEGVCCADVPVFKICYAPTCKWVELL
jgi:hypothetical protein